MGARHSPQLPGAGHHAPKRPHEPPEFLSAPSLSTCPAALASLCSSSTAPHSPCSASLPASSQAPTGVHHFSAPEMGRGQGGEEMRGLAEDDSGKEPLTWPCGGTQVPWDQEPRETLHTKSAPGQTAGCSGPQPPHLECVRVHLSTLLHCRRAHCTESGVLGVSGT